MNLLIQDLFLQEQVRPSSNRQMRHFQKNWKKLTSDPQILGIAEGYQIPFFIKAKPDGAFQLTSYNGEGGVFWWTWEFKTYLEKVPFGWQ